MLKIWPGCVATPLFNPGCSTCVIRERESQICVSHLCFLISEKKLLRDDAILKNLLAGTTVTIYFRDLGPQIGWTKVRNGH